MNDMQVKLLVFYMQKTKRQIIALAHLVAIQSVF